MHVQSHQVLPAAQVQTALVLVHQEDAVVAGVEGETEGPRCSCVHEFCVGSGAAFRKAAGENYSQYFLFAQNTFVPDLDEFKEPENNTLLTTFLENVCH